MKVIEKKVWRHAFKCHECKSRCEAEAGDVRVRNSAVVYAGETWEPVYYVACGGCGARHSLTAEMRLPSHVREMADAHPESAKPPR